jgi:flagellar biosynthesis protein FlhB
MVAAISIAAGFAAVVIAIGGVAVQLAARTRTLLATASDGDVAHHAVERAHGVIASVALAAIPIAMAAAVGALIGHIAIARGLWIPVRAVPGAPSSGAEASTVGQRLADTILSLGRAALLLAVAAIAIVAGLPRLAGASDATALLTSITSVLATVASAAIVVALTDVAWRYVRWQRSLQMTEREHRDELREMTGDPAMRRRLRAARHDDRAIVTGARVVIVDDQLAVAIGWRVGDRPHPVRIARGLESRRLIAAARITRIPIVADATLAHDLASSQYAVPEHAIARVAHVLAAIT